MKLKRKRCEESSAETENITKNNSRNNEDYKVILHSPIRFQEGTNSLNTSTTSDILNCFDIQCSIFQFIPIIDLRRNVFLTCKMFSETITRMYLSGLLKLEVPTSEGSVLFYVFLCRLIKKFHIVSKTGQKKSHTIIGRL